ncbi:MAG: 4Fe-4S binding protein [Ruthenibacterium lactatiformans]
MDAIGSDELGRAKIDYDKCVSCGMCLVNCPFGAIADKARSSSSSSPSSGATGSSPPWPRPLSASSAPT